MPGPIANRGFRQRDQFEIVSFLAGPWFWFLPACPKRQRQVSLFRKTNLKLFLSHGPTKSNHQFRARLDIQKALVIDFGNDFRPVSLIKINTNIASFPIGSNTTDRSLLQLPVNGNAVNGYDLAQGPGTRNDRVQRP